MAEDSAGEALAAAASAEAVASAVSAEDRLAAEVREDDSDVLHRCDDFQGGGECFNEQLRRLEHYVWTYVHCAEHQRNDGARNDDSGEGKGYHVCEQEVFRKGMEVSVRQRPSRDLA